MTILNLEITSDQVPLFIHIIVAYPVLFTHPIFLEFITLQRSKENCFFLFRYLTVNNMYLPILVLSLPI